MKNNSGTKKTWKNSGRSGKGKSRKRTAHGSGSSSTSSTGSRRRSKVDEALRRAHQSHLEHIRAHVRLMQNPAEIEKVWRVEEPKDKDQQGLTISYGPTAKPTRRVTGLIRWSIRRLPDWRAIFSARFRSRSWRISSKHTFRWKTLGSRPSATTS